MFNDLNSFSPSSKNIQALLRKRKIDPSFSGPTSSCIKRSYKHIFPDSILTTVRAPECFWKRFSPDGKLIIAQTKRASQPILQEISSLNGPYSTENLKIVILDINTGKELSKMVFESDLIHLNNHKGVSLYDNMLCVVSIKFQKIYVLKILDSGKLETVVTIGDNLYADDVLFRSKYPTDGSLDLSAQSSSRKRKRERSAATQTNTLSSLTDVSFRRNSDRERVERRRQRIMGYFNENILDLYPLLHSRGLFELFSEPNSSILLQNNFGILSSQVEQLEAERFQQPKSDVFFNGLKQRMYTFLYKQALASSNA
ncbi:hypothetical protein BB560_005614, partial [Smittium megazygosporum]